MYLAAIPQIGVNSGWQALGTWSTGPAVQGGADVTVTEAASYMQSAIAGTPQQFTFHYTNPYGPTDIVYGQTLFNSDPNGPNGNGACQIEWTSRGALNLLSGTGPIDGAFGLTPATALSNTSCSIDTLHSSLTLTPSGYDVTVNVTFTAQFSSPITTHQIFAFGENAEGVAG